LGGKGKKLLQQARSQGTNGGEEDPMSRKDFYRTKGPNAKGKGNLLRGFCDWLIRGNIKEQNVIIWPDLRKGKGGPILPPNG